MKILVFEDLCRIFADQQRFSPGKVTECGRQRSKAKTLLLQCCALCKIHMIDGQNMSDQIMSDRKSKHKQSNCVLCFPFILSGSPNKLMLATYMRCMCNNNLKIRIAGSSYCLQLLRGRTWRALPGDVKTALK